MIDPDDFDEDEPPAVDVERLPTLPPGWTPDDYTEAEELH